MNNNISIREARPEEAGRIADLIIMAMTEECCLHFCGPDHDIDDFRRVMISLVARTDTQYSYLNTLVAIEETAPVPSPPLPSAPVPGVSAPGCIVGICVSYDGALLHQLRQAFIDAAL